jgi:AraC family transcriptional regulator
MPVLHPVRFAQLPRGVLALTATARGMENRSLERAARSAFGELLAAVQAAGRLQEVSSWMALAPDVPLGAEDPQCRYVAAAVFGHDMARGRGVCLQPDVPLGGSLGWQQLDAGRCAVFLHTGPYSGLHATWTAIYRDWWPGSGEALRAAPPMELMLNNPETTAPENLKTEIWIPLA